MTIEPKKPSVRSTSKKDDEGLAPKQAEARKTRRLAANESVSRQTRRLAANHSVSPQTR